MYIEGGSDMKQGMVGKGVVCAVAVLFVGISSVPLVDSTPPVTTLSFDPEVPDGHSNWYVSNVTVTLNATDDFSGVNVTYYRINGGEWQLYNYPFLLNKSNYYTIEYYSIDNAGNVEDVQSASCKVDVVPPVTTYHIDDGGDVHICCLEATDDMSGVYATFISIDGGAWQKYGSPIKITVDSYSHTINFYSVDKAGNEEEIHQITIYPHPDESPPTISLSVEKIVLNKLKFIALAYDVGSGMDRVEFYIDSQFLGNVTGPGPEYEWNWTCPDADGHTVQAIAYDKAGNSAASNNVTRYHSFSYDHRQLRFTQLFLKFLERFFQLLLLFK
jgi:hypothetical protein